MAGGASRPHILVFDSGIGGMGVVQALRDASLKHAAPLHVDYLADTALFPYGEQPDDGLVPRIVFLLREASALLQPDVIVIACNTASTIALPALRDTLHIPIVGCVPPIRWAGRVSITRTIGLLSTAATARRPYILDLHRRFAPDCRLLTHGARLLADLAERAFLGDEIADADLQPEIDRLFGLPHGARIDTVGLGCTHYTFLMPGLTRLAPHRVSWLDPAPAVAERVFSVLQDCPRHSHGPDDPHLLMTRLPTNATRLEQAVERIGFRQCTQFNIAEEMPAI